MTSEPYMYSPNEKSKEKKKKPKTRDRKRVGQRGTWRGMLRTRRKIIRTKKAKQR